MTQKTEFALWFAGMRKEIGSQEEAADKMKIGRATVARWEAGKNAPSIENLQCIADAFGVSKEEVARRAGLQAEIEYSNWSLSLARLIESKSGALSEEKKAQVVRGIDSLLTAFSPSA